MLIKPRKYWTEEQIIKEVKKFDSLTDWFYKSRSSYSAAKKKNIFEKVSLLFTRKVNQKIYWKKEEILEKIKKFQTIKEWREKSLSSYTAAKKLNIFEEISDGLIKLRKYWTNQDILLDALKFKTKTEWRKSSSSYVVAARRNLINIASEHMETLGNTKKRCVYTLSIPKKKIIYIGITYNFKKRITDHFRSTNKIKKLINLYGKQNIQVKKITDYIEYKEASYLEKKLISKYLRRKYNVLNVMPGGQLGGNTKFWTENKVIEEALKYKTVKEWISNNPRSYDAARRNNLLKKCTMHMKRQSMGRWRNYTKEMILNEAKKFKTRTEWYKKSIMSWKYAKREGWFAEATSHMNLKKIGWTKDKLLESAKNFNTKIAWYKAFPGVRHYAKKNNLLELATSHMIKNY